VIGAFIINLAVFIIAAADLVMEFEEFTVKAGSEKVLVNALLWEG